MAVIVEFVKLGADAWVVPAGVVSVQVHCIGAGGRGRSVNGSASSGNRRSGGGGGYSSSTLAVTPGEAVPLQVNSSGTWFRSSTTLLANPGQAGPVGAGGAGAARGVGDVTFAGGFGQATTQNSQGGGGGGSAGPSGNGWNGSNAGGGGGSNGGLGTAGNGAAGGSGSLGGGVAAGNGAGGSRRGAGIDGDPGTMQALWTSKDGEVAGPGGGGGSGNYTNGGDGGSYGGGGGGGGGASGDPYTAGLGGAPLIVVMYEIENVYKGAAGRAARYLGTRDNASLYLGAKAIF